MNTGEIKTQVLVELGVSTSTAYYTDTIIDNWIDRAHKFAAGTHKWPSTEGRVSTTYASTEENDYPEGWKSDSIRLMQIGGKRFIKLNFHDYQAFREDNASASDKVFSDYGRIYYVNPNSGVSGTTILYGQYTPAKLDATDPTQYTVFSASEEGDYAIIEEVISYAKIREKKAQEAQLHHDRSMGILEGLWRKIQQEQYAYQTKNNSMFKRIDVLGGTYLGENLNRINQFL